jgi:hypothetical protein
LIEPTESHNEIYIRPFLRGVPQPLFEISAVSTTPQRNVFLYSPAPNSRFLVNILTETVIRPQLHETMLADLLRSSNQGS